MCTLHRDPASMAPAMSQAEAQSRGAIVDPLSKSSQANLRATRFSDFLNGGGVVARVRKLPGHNGKGYGTQSNPEIHKIRPFEFQSRG